MITGKPTSVSVPSTGTAGSNFNVSLTTPGPEYGALRSATAQGAPQIVSITSPASGATLTVPGSVTGTSWPPGGSVQFLNDTTGNPLGDAVLADAVTGAFTFTVTTTGN